MEDRKHIITIAGRPGSGKSTTSKRVAQELGYDHFSSGDLFRAIAREKGAADVHAANLAAEQGDNIDSLVDRRLQEIGATRDRLAIDSRTAWHWMPNSFKVYLDLDLLVAARRIIANTDPERLKNEHVPEDPVEYAKVLQARLDSETRRYKNLYGIDPYDASNYDLVIDTEVNGPEEVVSLIIRGFRLWTGDND